MEKYIDKLFSLKSFPGQLIFVLWLSSLMLLIFPESWLEKFMLTEFKNKFAVFIGPTFLFSSAVTIYMVSRFFIRRFNTVKYKKKYKEEILHNLNNLTYPEKNVLREFLLQGKTTILASLNDETVISLESKHLIYKATSSAVVSGLDMCYPYSIDKFAHENLIGEKVDLPNDPNDINDQLRQKIISERPQWAKDLENKKRMHEKYVSMPPF